MGSIDPPTNGYTSTEQNGVNGGDHKSDIPPVTSIFASFVANGTTTYLTPHIRSRLKEFILDYIGVTLAAAHTSDSTPSFLNAVKALGGETTAHDACTVLGVGRSFTPQYAALLNA